LKINWNSYWIKSGSFSLIQNVSALVLGFGGFFCLVRILDKADFGAWALFLTVTSLFEIARIGFIKNGFIKYLASSEAKDHNSIFTASLVLNLILTLFISVGMLILAQPLSETWNAPQLKVMFRVYALTSVLLVPFFQFDFVQNANYDFRSVFFCSFVRNVILFAGILGAYVGLYHMELITLVLIHASAALTGSIVSFFLTRKQLIFKLVLNWRWVAELSHYGKYVVGTSLSSMLYSAVDQFMLGSLVSTSSVASYNASGRVTNLINVPSATLAPLVFPKSAKLFHAEGGTVAVKNLYEKSVGAILSLVIPSVAFVFVFPELIITLLAGSKYLDTVPVLQVTVLYCLFIPFANQFGIILDSIGKPNINFYYTSVSLVVNIVVNYFLIRSFGIMGAVYGTMGTIIVGFIFMQLFLYNKLGISMLNIFRNILFFYQNFFSHAVYLLKRSKLDEKE
jgi:O-antigen/teichoic acid export membrane protein